MEKLGGSVGTNRRRAGRAESYGRVTCAGWTHSLKEDSGHFIYATFKMYIKNVLQIIGIQSICAKLHQVLHLTFEASFFWFLIL